MSVFQRSRRPPFIENYLERTSWKLRKYKPFEELRLITLDTEASGFTIGRDRMLSIAVIEMDWSRIKLDTRIEWMVYQPNMAVNKATEIHGILPSDTLRGTPEKQMLEELLPKLSGALVVGHQILFDALMLNDALRRNFGIPFRNPMIDVGPMAMNELQPFRKSGYANQRPPSLEDLCAHFGLPLHDRHTAEGDAFIAGELFLLMCGHIRRRKGRITRWDLPIKKV